MYAFVFLSILKDKHIHNRLLLAYRTEASFNSANVFISFHTLH